MPSIQDEYNIRQQKGYVGQAPARPGQSLGENLLEVNTDGLAPGDAYIINASGQAEAPADAAGALDAVGVVSYDQGTINVDITQTVNHKTGVVYSVGDFAPCVEDGTIYVLAGGAIVKGQGVNFDPATGKWTAGGASTKSYFVSQDTAVDGDIIAIRVGRIT